MKMDAIASRKDGGGFSSPFQPRLRLQGIPPAPNPMVLIVKLANFLLCPHSQRAYCKIGNDVGLCFFFLHHNPHSFNLPWGQSCPILTFLGLRANSFFNERLLLKSGTSP